MTTDAQAALAQVREALADPMLFDWARDWDRARATRVLERACSPANIAAILAHVETQAAEVERLTEENRRLRADLLAGRNVVNAGLTIHTLTIERDMLRQEIERLTAALQYEQYRAGRQGTHGDGCADWGPEHYECAIRERDERRRQLAEAELDAQRYRWLRKIAHQNTAYDVYKDGAHWSVGLHSDDHRQTFDQAIDAAMGASNE